MSEPRAANAEEQARLDHLREQVSGMDLPEGVTIDFAFRDDEETIDEIAANEAAVFAHADGFSYFRGGQLPVLPAIELSGLDWLERAIRAGRTTCAAHGIGHQIDGLDVPLYASFQISIDGRYTPLMIWIPDAPKRWLEEALLRFVVVWPEGPDGQRAWMATGPLSPFPEGVVVPPRMGRNDPCPCGSGKKWKRCHGA